MASDTSRICPIGDYVVIKPAPREEITPTGIVIPETAKEKSQEGVVLTVGKGKLDANGKHVAPQVHVGDRVLFAKYSGTEYVFEGEDLLFLHESDVLIVIEGHA